MKYIIVSAAKALSLRLSPKDVVKNLEHDVNEKILEGWKPVGGIAVDNFGLYQAMVNE